MYEQQVTTKEQAIAHLFFHCCFRDDVATKLETTAIADKLVLTGVSEILNMKDEVVHYKAYQSFIKNEREYLQHLIGLLPVANPLALYSYCVELCLSDLLLQPADALLLQQIAFELNIDDTHRQIIDKLILERQVVESGKLF